MKSSTIAINLGSQRFIFFIGFGKNNVAVNDGGDVRTKVLIKELD
jgi:hypothetical protein